MSQNWDCDWAPQLSSCFPVVFSSYIYVFLLMGGFHVFRPLCWPLTCTETEWNMLPNKVVLVVLPLLWRKTWFRHFHWCGTVTSAPLFTGDHVHSVKEGQIPGSMGFFPWSLPSRTVLKTGFIQKATLCYLKLYLIETCCGSRSCLHLFSCFFSCFIFF